MEHVAEIAVPVPPAVAYSYLADLRNEPAWRFDVASSELRSGTAGQAGATYAQHITTGKREVDNTVEVTAADGQSLISFTSSDGKVRVDGTYRVASAADGSVVTTTIVLAPSGAAKLLTPLLRGELRRVAQRYSVDLVSALTPPGEGEPSRTEDAAAPDEPG
jgi:hypothetical protein